MRSRLGRYTVLKHLASGGMADLLLGRADGIEGFARHVVLKRIRPEYARDQRFIRMFLDEARVAASLHHQHVVQVYDIGEADGDYFFAMEHVHGEDVRTMLSHASKTRAHLPLPIALAIVSAAAAGLHHAHERRGPGNKLLGIVHRDVSPSNIVVGFDGAIKLLDFGIAKAASHDDTGVLKGKISYMSPEQCRAEDVDRRSDVYSLGVVLYELVTTSRMIKGESDYQMLDQVVHGRIALPQVRRPDLPKELASIILCAIATERDRRYTTADELRDAIDQFATTSGNTATASQLAAFMRKQFGDKPEPWLELDGEFTDSFEDDAAPTAAAPRSTWTELRPGDSLPSSSMPRLTSPSAAGLQRVTPPNTVPMPLSSIDWSPLIKAAIVGVPILAILLVIAIWKLAATSADDVTAVATTSTATPTSTPAAVPAPAPPAAAPTPAPPAPVVASRTVAPAPSHARTAKHAKEPQVAASPKEAPEEAPPPAPAIAAAPEPVTAAMPPAAAPPPPVPAVSVVRPAAPVAPRNIAPKALDANRIGGDKDIVPDSLTQREIARSGADQITGSYKLCVSAAGTIESVSPLKSTGFPAYDTKIASTIRAQWRYRPFVIDGAPAAVCTAVRFVYSQR